MNRDLKFVDINGVKLAFFQADGDSVSEQTVLFVHGLACHARCWDETLRLLGRSCSSVCIELRGHGRSEKRGPYVWGQFGSDLCKFIQELDLVSIIGVGHSMGGHLLLQAASVLTNRFDSLVLLEPAVFHPRAYAEAKTTKIFNAPTEHPFARRKAVWNSPDEWIEAIRDRSPFKRWKPEVLRDHCQHGLEPTDLGQYQLCCPPEVEAETFLNCMDTNIHPMLSLVDMPVTVVRAKTAPGFKHPFDNIHSVTWPDLADSLPQGTDKYRSDLSHFVPMQRPDVVAGEIRDVLGI